MWRPMRLLDCATALKKSSQPSMAAARRSPRPQADVVRRRATAIDAERGNVTQCAARAEAAKNLETAVTVAKEFAAVETRQRAVSRRAGRRLSEESAGSNGLERVAFEIATIDGASFGPLAKIASGGELARFALALKVALAAASPPAVLVFDEVDRGVGGAVAAAVGERLQRLARRPRRCFWSPILRKPRRARRAISASRGKATPRASSELTPEERVEEIARMLSGAAVTEEARAAARRLVAEAQAQRTPKKRARA